MTNETIGDLADPQKPVRTVPRFALRTFWLLHRAMVRLSGRRFGLTRPEAGERFGMMRLTTLGRRSGATRVAIVGYYEDGAGLVTLAMNGWGRTEPAWWLNLQANPDATVELPDGPRAVRARAASGEERDRLWAKFRDYPGWAADVDASAALRPTPTAVIVLEPRDARSETTAPAIGVPSDVPSDVPADLQATAVAAAPITDAHPPRRLALRHLWIVPGLGIALFANAQATTYAVGLVPLLLFGIVPHLPALAGNRSATRSRSAGAASRPALQRDAPAGPAAGGARPGRCRRPAAVLAGGRPGVAQPHRGRPGLRQWADGRRMGTFGTRLHSEAVGQNRGG